MEPQPQLSAYRLTAVFRGATYPKMRNRDYKTLTFLMPTVGLVNS